MKQGKKNYFFLGIIIAVIAGVIGSFFVGSFFYMMESLKNSFINNIIILLTSGFGLFYLIIFMKKQVKLK